MIVVVLGRVPWPRLAALKCEGKEVTSAISTEYATVVDGPTKVLGRLGCVAMTVLGVIGTIGVKAPVSAGRESEAALEEEARARLAGVMLGESMPVTIARLLGTTGRVSMAVAGRIVVGMAAGLIFLGPISSSTFAHLHIAEGIL